MFSSVRKEEAKKSDARSAHLRILVVEDESRIVALLLELIQRIGCIPESATSCKEALIKATKGAYDIILLVYHLPDGTGADLLTRIKQLQPDADIVTMTGKNSREIEQLCRNRRVIYHLVKPFEFNELISLINHVAQRRSKKE